MAQLYVLRGMETGKVKLGVTNNFSGRLPAYKTHCAEPLEVVLVYQSNFDTGALKRQFEAKFIREWGHLLTHGEWYLKSDDMLIAVLKWVLRSEAERIAIQQTFQNRPGLMDRLVEMTDQELEEWMDDNFPHTKPGPPDGGTKLLMMPGRAAAPDYDTGSQEVRRGRRRG